MVGKNSVPYQKILLDRLDNMQNQADSEDDLSFLGTELVLINFAFDRIHTGEYWHCVECGEEITEKRLLSDPTTLVCSTCAPRPDQ